MINIEMASLQNMPASPLIVSIICMVIISFTTSSEAASYIVHTCLDMTARFTPNSTYQSNLNSLLSALSSNASLTQTGFHKDTAGGKNSTDDTVYGLFLCRGDMTRDACAECVATAATEAVQRCYSIKHIVIWYDECMLRYSNQSFFAIPAHKPGVFRQTTAGVTEPSGFNQILATTVDELATGVVANAKFFATKEANMSNGSNNITLYSLGQCTQDLSAANCSWCLRAPTESAIADIVSTGYQGGKFLYASCSIIYQLSPFYDLTATTPPQPTLPKGRRSKLSSKIVIASILGVVAVSVVIAVLSYYFVVRRRARNKHAQPQEKAGNDLKITIESLQFELGTIERATSNFSIDNKLGQGGFGEVFKGTLGNGQEIAVKRLSQSSNQGVEEFKNEVVLVAKLQHRNLVRLLGFCLEGIETLLVYEYVPNKSLDYFLFEIEKREQLDWSRRCKIIEGIARGILYLHEDSRLRVIHRDLKASNVLLGEDMNPKISDFGMAKMFGVDGQTQGNTRRIVGTYGYMAPEYAKEGLYSIKSDVFSFGILLLEIITGRKNFLGFNLTNCPPTLIAYAWELWNEEKGLELIDSLLKDSSSPDEFLRYMHIGLLCVQDDANKRPTMSLVVLMLKTKTTKLSKPERPAFFTERSTAHDHNQIGDHHISFAASGNDLTVSDNLPR